MFKRQSVLGYPRQIPKCLPRLSLRTDRRGSLRFLLLRETLRPCRIPFMRHLGCHPVRVQSVAPVPWPDLKYPIASTTSLKLRKRA